jgi:hypothetical protein
VCQKTSREFQNGGTDIHVYNSSVRHSTSEMNVDPARVTKLILEIDDSEFGV